jgi:hypothetical protein
VSARSRRIVRILVLVLLNLALLELAASGLLVLRPGIFRELASGPERRDALLAAGLRRTFESRPEALVVLDPRLGWRPRPGMHVGPDDVDARGLRSRREYAPEPASGVLRIAVFGDSFVYGSEVATADAWPTRLEELRPATEVLNYGVPGYGQDQIHLRFLEEGGDLRPRVVLFGVASPTAERIVAVLGAFRSLEAVEFGVMSKPRYVLGGSSGLELVPNPLARPADLERYLARPSALGELGRLDFWYEPLLYESWWFDHSRACRILFAGWAIAKRRYVDADRPFRGPPGRAVLNESSSSFKILTTILERSLASARERGMEPAILLLPDKFGLERSRSGETDEMEPLRAWCLERKLPLLDAARAFLALPASTEWASLFAPKFHYSAEGNRVLAEWLRSEIDRRGW